MSILVTGGSGFVGTHMARMLVEQGRDVVVYDLGRPNVELFGDVLKKVKIVRADLLDIGMLIRTIKEHNVERIIHAAALLPERCKEMGPLWTVKVNVECTANVLEAARIMDVKRVVCHSTSGVYGHGAHKEDLKPIKEEEAAPLKGHSGTLYEVTKFSEELLCLGYAQTYGLDSVVVRPGRVYGPGRLETRVPSMVDYFIQKAAAAQSIIMESGGDLQTHCDYVKDTARGIIQVLEASSLKHRVYNINSPVLVTLSEICRVIKKVFPEINIKIGPGTDFAPGVRLNKDISGPPDITRARTDLGWEPQYTLEEGIRETKEWLRTKKLA